jgi:ribosomal protein S18 acetylase RimI-like enzyme
MGEEVIRRARTQDADALVDIYTECFPERVREVFGVPYRRALIRDYLLFYLSWDPGHNWVTVRDGEVVGFVIAPCRYSPLRATLTHGQVWRWLWHLVSGQYGLPLHIFRLFLASGFALDPDPVIQRLWGKPMIHLCAVRTHHQGQGVGSHLMARTLTSHRQDGANCCWLVAHHDNLRALALYKKFGFGCYGTVSQGDIVMVLGTLNRVAS